MNDSRVRLAGSAGSRYAGALWLACTLMLAQAASAGELSPYTAHGIPAPAFTLKALDGKPHGLAGYRGKVLLLNFWASWCPPCLAELPGIQRLADRMAGEAFEVVLINVGESAFRVSKFMKLTGVRLTALLDDKGETFKAWGGTLYPTSFVLDTKGQVRYVAYGPLEWDGEDVVTTLRDLVPSAGIAAE